MSAVSASPSGSLAVQASVTLPLTGFVAPWSPTPLTTGGRALIACDASTRLSLKRTICTCAVLATNGTTCPNGKISSPSEAPYGVKG